MVAALVGASTAGAARNLCTAAQPIVKGVLGVPNTPLKEYHHQAGIFLLCQYGPSEGGAAITENPNVTAAAFKAKQHSMGGVATSGVGVPAFLVPGSFPTLYFLKGTTELSVGAKVQRGGGRVFRSGNA